MISCFVAGRVGPRVRGGCSWVYANFVFPRCGKVDLENLFGNDAGAVEGVIEPEVGGERVTSGGGDDAVFEEVAGFESEDADGLDADVLVGGGVDDGGIGVVGDRAGKNVGGAAARMGDVD